GSENCGVLNFASAKNPGGGFLNGSLAQEEALAISSDLYNSQLQAQAFYDINKGCKTSLYTHNMIYSRNVTFIRDGNMKLMESPISANILTSPAVNAGAYYNNENGKESIVLAVMEERIRYILNVLPLRMTVL
ncbi:MAG: TIGR02452 family protein, partial [Lachnospiraceae bacterium]|nr:TIGR02452 family protein [Lachnospiraceae bacterium]